MKIEEYLNTLPESILSGQDVQLSEQTFRDIFKFVNLGKNDVFYHLGCGNGVGLVIAKEEFNAKKVIGIDIQFGRNDVWLNGHSKTVASIWRSNTDLQPVTSIRKLFLYLSK